MAIKESEIQELLQKSLIDDEMKDSLRAQLSQMTEAQKEELLGILHKEQEMLEEEVTKENAPIYAKLKEDMDVLLYEHLRKARQTLESQDKQSEGADLAALEQELDNL